MLSKKARGQAIVATLQQFSHEGHNWVHLEEVGQVIAPVDKLFMLRYAIGEKAMDLVKPNRPKDPYDLGYAYLPRLYKVAGMLEEEGKIESDFETEPTVRKIYSAVKPWLAYSQDKG